MAIRNAPIAMATAATDQIMIEALDRVGQMIADTAGGAAPTIVTVIVEIAGGFAMLTATAATGPTTMGVIIARIGHAMASRSVLAASTEAVCSPSPQSIPGCTIDHWCYLANGTLQEDPAHKRGSLAA